MDEEVKKETDLNEHFAGNIFAQRKEILSISGSVKILREHPLFGFKKDFSGDEAEMKANIMLAYRHLEDARMRLGKVVQAQDGGKSVYNK